MNACLGESCLQGYLEESGSSQLRRTVETHMVSCAACRVAFERVVATHQRVNEWLARLCLPAIIAPVDARRALTEVLGRAEGRHRFFVAGELRSSGNPRAFAISVGVQSAVVAVLMLVGTSTVVRHSTAPFVLVAPPPVVRPMEARRSHSGGGGGQRSPLPAAKGQLPKPATKTYIPPVSTVSHPLLTIDASLIAPPNAWAVPTSAIGIPFGLSITGGGPGRDGGPGGGDGGRIGDGGNGGPPGDGTQAAFTAGNGVTRPELISKVDPEYSEEARKAKYCGSVTLSIVVNTDGKAESIRVLKSLGMGLDEKAMEAVRQWRFRPGVSRGAPVRVRAQVEVNFRLL